MTSDEYKRVIEIIIEMAQDGCVVLDTHDTELLRKFDEV